MPLRDMDREQMWLLPPSLDELLPLDHPARFVAEFVDALDREGWNELGVAIEGDPLGAPSYHPRAMLCVWLYGFMTGSRSSRKLEAACRDQIPFLWLTGWQHPDHNTLWRFYKDHRQAMRSLFKRTVRTAIAMELVDLAMQAVDGTKVIASAARERNYDAKRLDKLLERVEKAILDLDAQNEAGEDAAPVHLPEELAEKRVLRDQVRQAMDELASQEDPKVINLTDRDARMMKTRYGILPAYNAEAMVSPFDPEGGGGSVLITAVDLVDEPNDYGQLTPMLERAEEITGSKADMTLADGGYHSGRNLEECARREQAVAMPQAPRRRSAEHPYHRYNFAYDQEGDSYICPQGQTLRFVGVHRSGKVMARRYRGSAPVCRSCPAFGVCTKDGVLGRSLVVTLHDEALYRHRAWMSTDEAREVCKLRKQLVEPVFGIVKEQQNARRFLLRGLANVAAEWTALATAFNMRVLWQKWRSRRFTFPAGPRLLQLES